MRKHYRWLTASPQQRRKLQLIDRGKGLVKKTAAGTTIYIVREGGERVDSKMVSALLAKGCLVEKDDGSYRVSVL